MQAVDRAEQRQSLNSDGYSARAFHESNRSRDGRFAHGRTDSARMRAGARTRRLSFAVTAAERYVHARVCSLPVIGCLSGLSPQVQVEAPPAAASLATGISQLRAGDCFRALLTLNDVVSRTIRSAHSALNAVRPRPRAIPVGSPPRNRITHIKPKKAPEVPQW